MFAGSVAESYERYMVPLVFAPYATDVAARVARHAPTNLLEVACGTGVVTRALAAALPPTTAMTVTDLAEPMLAKAKAIGLERDREVVWRTADALALPFPDGAFDAVVCQFGAMFFPDRARGYAEAKRVLRAGGRYTFSTWDRIETSPVVAMIERWLGARYPADPPRFMSRTPHGYHDPDQIARDVVAGGFGAPSIERVEHATRTTAGAVARAIVSGTPLRMELAAREDLGGLVDLVERAVAAEYGGGDFEFPMAAYVVEVVA